LGDDQIVPAPLHSFLDPFGSPSSRFAQVYDFCVCLAFSGVTE
jgi:hypothetical protein